MRVSPISPIGERIGQPLDPSREAALVRAAQRGSVPAFELLVRQYGDLLYHFLYLRLGTEADARDALQETLIVAWTSLKTLRDPNSARAWLLTVAARQASALARRARKATPPQSEPSDEARDGLDLRAALAALPADQRDVILLRYFVGLSELETATTLGVAVGTVKSRAFRAREAIGNHLDISEEHQ